MSIRVMSLVWGEFPGGGSELLALLAMADWSDDEGRCWPSMSAIAKKTRLSRSQAQRIVHSLIKEKFVSVTGNEAGGPPGATRQYQIQLNRLTGRTGAAGSVDATGRTDAQDGSHGCVETGRMDATQTIIEPSIIIKESEQACSSCRKGRKKNESMSLADFLVDCNGKGMQAIQENDPVYEYAEKVGLDHEMIAVCWHRFKSAYLADKRKQADWRATFRNAVRGNWYKLWYIRGDQPASWTTVGKQARREAS